LAYKHSNCVSFAGPSTLIHECGHACWPRGPALRGFITLRHQQNCAHRAGAIFRIALFAIALVGCFGGSPQSDEPELMTILRGHGERALSIAISADCQTLASGCSDGTVRVWDLETAELRFSLTEHTDLCSGLGFSPNGKILATGSEDVKLWESATGRILCSFAHGPRVMTTQFSPDGKILATEIQQGSAKLWDVETRQLRATLRGYEGSLTPGLAFSPDGKFLATASLHEAFPNLPKLWSPVTGEPLAKFQGEEVSPRCLSFSPDANTLAVGMWHGCNVRLFDVRSRTDRGSLTHWCPISQVAFWPDGKTLAVAGSLGRYGRPPEVVLWDLPSGKQLRVFQPHPSKAPLFDTNFSVQAFSPDGKLWATGCADNTIKLWRLSTD